MNLSIRSHVCYKVPAAPCTFVLNVEAATFGNQNVIKEALQATPETTVEKYDSGEFGNRFTRCEISEAGQVGFIYEATVAVEHTTADPQTIEESAPVDLPLSILPYVAPSRYCESDRLMRMAQLDFGALEPGFDRVIAICDWITSRVEYRLGSTDSQTSAFDTATELHGVCRDFAHLGIAFCRALSIPARFVSVYAHDLQPQDFHAVFEAYLGGRWWLFDPTRMVPLDSIVRIGTGRDAADVPFANIWGDAALISHEVSVDKDDSSKTEWDGGPVSICPASGC